MIRLWLYSNTLSQKMPLPNWRALLGSASAHSHHVLDEASRRLLDAGEDAPTAYPPEDVTNVALRIKYLVEQVIPCELEEAKITRANSSIITPKVVHAAKEAGGKEHASCVLFCLLICRKWFKKQALLELWDEPLFSARATACEVIAKQIIEGEEREDYLMQETLLKRFSILVNGQATEPANVIERAVDLHALRVIGSSGYQKCIRYLWRGWLVQDENDPSSFVPVHNKTNTDYWAHFHQDRMRAPQYQNLVQMSMSIIYLALYTGAINTINHTGDLDVVEGILYIMTAGFIFDELNKLRKVGRYYIGFWNSFNSTLYVLLTTSFILRMIALSHDLGTDERIHFNKLSYNFFAFSAPMFWMRLLLYLDTYRFFGAMLVILKTMMKESLIFFALLIVICIGFLQAFVAMDVIDDNKTVTSFILTAMANSVMQSPDFSGFDNFSPPFGIILYYLYTFVVMVVLLNILIALYNSAYESVTDEADDEYMALFSSKTMQFVRAPDENVFIPPFNLIETFCLVLPLEWWMPRSAYQKLNDIVMLVIYSPLLLVTAWVEQKEAYRVLAARRRGESDEDRVEEWEQLGSDGWQPDLDDDWAKKVTNCKPDVATDAAVIEIRELKSKVNELAEAIKTLQDAKVE